MTVAPDTAPQAFPDLESAVRSLRAAGLRLSTPRRLVLEALFAAEGPVAATHLARTLALDESSVYRNLELLEERGVVRHLHLGHSPGLYVLARPEEVEYLYCERCARVTAISPAELDPVRERLEDELGFSPRFHHFAIVGVCAACRRRPGAVEAPAVLHSHGDYVHAHRDAGDHAHRGAGAPTPPAGPDRSR